AGVDPLIDQGDFVFAWPRFLVCRRHRIIGMDEPLIEFRFGGVTGNDLLPADESLSVEDVIQPAFVRPVIAVAAMAIGLENRLNFLGQIWFFRLGTRAEGSRAEHGG